MARWGFLAGLGAGLQNAGQNVAQQLQEGRQMDFARQQFAAQQAAQRRAEAVQNYQLGFRTPDEVASETADTGGAPSGPGATTPTPDTSAGPLSPVASLAGPSGGALTGVMPGGGVLGAARAAAGQSPALGPLAANASTGVPSAYDKSRYLPGPNGMLVDTQNTPIAQQLRMQEALKNALFAQQSALLGARLNQQDVNNQRTTGTQASDTAARDATEREIAELRAQLEASRFEATFGNSSDRLNQSIGAAFEARNKPLTQSVTAYQAFRTALDQAAAGNRTALKPALVNYMATVDPKASIRGYMVKMGMNPDPSALGEISNWADRFVNGQISPETVQMMRGLADQEQSTNRALYTQRYQKFLKQHADRPGIENWVDDPGTIYDIPGQAVTAGPGAAAAKPANPFRAAAPPPS